MTQVTEKTVTVKVKNHPRDMFYSGRQTREHLSGMMQYMSKGGKLLDVERVQEFLKTVGVEQFVNDKKVILVLGVEHNQYRVEELYQDSFIGMNILTKEVKTLSAEDLTVALGSGFCEILYRDDKPYGIETEKQVKVKIIEHLKKEENAK